MAQTLVIHFGDVGDIGTKVQKARMALDLVGLKNWKWPSSMSYGSYWLSMDMDLYSFDLLTSHIACSLENGSFAHHPGRFVEERTSHPE